MKQLATKLYIIIGVFFTFSCAKEIKRHEIHGYAQGTTYKVVYYNTNNIVAQQDIDSIFTEFNSSCSLYDKNSLISRINRGETDSVDNHIIACEKIARELYTISDGAFDITSYPLTRAYGFLSEERAENINLDSLMQYVGHSKIRIENGRLIRDIEGVSINLNSIAQGYSVDLVAKYLKKRGLNDFLIELGGEIYCSGYKPNNEKWRLGIDRPVDGNITPGEEIALVITVTDKGVNTSGNYRNFYEKGDKRYNHIIDSKSGESSINDMLSATVIAESAALSDGIATMLMILGSEKSIEFLEKRDDIEGYIIYQKENTMKTYTTIKPEN